MKYFFPQFCDTKILTIFSHKRAKLVKFTLENQKGTKINKNICHAKESVWVPTEKTKVLQQLGRMILEVRKVTQNGKYKRDRDPQQWFIHSLAKKICLFGDKSERLHLKKQRKT